MGRLLIFMLLAALALGGLAACGRKAPPRLPEGVRLTVQQEGARTSLGIFNPFEEEIEPVEFDELDEALESELPLEPEEGGEATTGVEVERGGPSDPGPARRFLRDVVNPVEQRVEDALIPSDVADAPEPPTSPSADGMPPSPGSSREGGF